MKNKMKILLLALTLGSATMFMSCSDDDAEDDVCGGLTQEQCDDLL